jgi:ATP-dependent protease HslVU (ClpYQ) peptidase subunit
MQAEVQYPPNPFRSLIRKPKFRLTAVIAIEAKDGLVMGADSQQTSWVKEVTNKIGWLAPTVLLGCAGSSQYIDILRSKIQQVVIDKLDELNQGLLDFKAVLNTAIDEYGKYAAERIDNLKLRSFPNFDIRDYYPEGLCAVFKTIPRYSQENPLRLGDYHIYEIKTPHPCLDIVPRHRAAIGSGGDAATVILKTVEEYLEAYGLNWTNFSAKVINQFIGMVLQRIARIDPYSSGIELWTLKPIVTETTPVIFDPQTDHLSYLLPLIIAELPRSKIAEIVRRSNLLDVLKMLGLG